MKARSAKFGISKSAAVEMVVRDEVAIVCGEAHPEQVYLERQGTLEPEMDKCFEAGQWVGPREVADRFRPAPP